MKVVIVILILAMIISKDFYIQKIGQFLYNENYKDQSEFFFELSAKNRNSSYLYLGHIEKKRGNYEEALQNYLFALTPDSVVPYFCISAGIYQGYFFKDNEPLAFEFMRISAERDYPRAMYWLYVFYYNGYGVSKDLSQSEYWYQKSQNHGYNSVNDDIKMFPENASFSRGSSNKRD